MTSCDIYLSTKINHYSFESIAKEKVLTFADAIYLKVARQVYVETQIELEIWANCSEIRNKIFYAIQIKIFWISLKLRV